MTNTFSIGMIGAGMIAKSHLKCLQKEPRATVTWVCDVNETAARAAAKEFEIPHVATDYKDILADPAVDAVLIATPPFLHAEMFGAALAAGKHVLVEKPLAVTPAQLHEMTVLAAAHPDQLTLDASCRHARLQPKFPFVKGLIDSGKLGQVYHIHHASLGRGTFIEYNKNGAWAMDKKLAGGGPLVDWGVYDLSFHLGILGDTPELTAVQSFTRNDLRDMSQWVAFSDVEQHGAAWLTFTGGLTYYYERGAGVHGETKNDTRINGTKGGLHLRYTSWDTPVIEYFYADPAPQKEELTVDMSQHTGDDNYALAQHFMDCLEGKAKPLMPIARAAKHMEILFKIVG